MSRKWTSFHVIICFYIYSSVEHPFLPFVHFLIELFVSITADFWEFIIHSRYYFFFGYVVCRYFLPFRGLSFLSVLLILMQPELSFFFFFLDHDFGVKSKNSFPTSLDLRDFLLCFFLKILLTYTLHLSLWCILINFYIRFET